MHCSSTIVRFTAGLLLLAPLVARAQGQQGSGSPYSAYGLGELIGGTQVSQAIMGSLGVAVMDPGSVVSANPASYSMLQRTCFETGVVSRNSQFATDASEGTGRRVDLLGLSLGVPFGKGRWGMGLGVNPVSNVGYRITNAQAIPDGSGTVTYQYTGDGGLNRAFLGAGWTVSQKRDSLSNGHRFAVGANLSYVFGNIEESRKAIYPSFSGFYNTSAISSLVVRDVTANVGMHFQGDLRRRVTKDDKVLRYLAGVTAELPTNIGARRTDLVTSYVLSASGVELPYDTIYYADGTQGTLGLPLGIGLGFTAMSTHWTFSAEVKQRDWRDLKVKVEGYELPTELASSTTYTLGTSYRPANEVGGTFWERTIYRAGLRYNNDYLVVDGTQLSEMALSAGMSLPLMGSATRSRLNIGAELGERGTTDNGLIRERFASFYIGITITPDQREPWFKKRRID